MGRSRGKIGVIAPLLLALSFASGLGLSRILARPAMPDLFASFPPCVPEPAAEVHNCRFWGIISDCVPGSVIEDHLVNSPNSIGNLSPGNPNGWSVAFVSAAASAAVVKRGQPPAYLDALFDEAVSRAADAFPTIVISHIRQCTSGLCDIPNPHPFVRWKHGKHWLMAHNGTIDKNVLLSLLRPEYLAENPPENGNNPFEWIDSELYFLFVLQTLEDHAWQIKPALGEVIERLREYIPGDGETLNFVLTDGVSLWAYRQGPTLYYRYETDGTPYAAVASQYPSSLPEDWVALADGQLITMDRGGAPVIEDITDYFGPALSAGLDPVLPAERSLALATHPNPFRQTTEITYLVRPDTGVSPAALDIYDAEGRLVAALRGDVPPAGARTVTWDGTDSSGRPLASGIYFCRLSQNGRSLTRRMVLIR